MKVTETFKPQAYLMYWSKKSMTQWVAKKVLMKYSGRATPERLSVYCIWVMNTPM